MFSLLRTAARQFRCLGSTQHVCPLPFSKSFSVMGLKERKIELLVCDMAGTTVDEGGAVYVALRDAMNKHGLEVQVSEMDPWHGVMKGEVIEHFVKDRGLGDAAAIEKTFEGLLEDAYFSPDSPISLINTELIEYFTKVRKRGIKIALNTGYPPKIQAAIIDKLNMQNICDDHISAYDVKEGRPYPYMIHHLMERFGIKSSKQVAKAGDTVADIGEAVNAGCGYVIGVESGADDKNALVKAGADIVVHDVTCVPIFSIWNKYKMPI